MTPRTPNPPPEMLAFSRPPARAGQFYPADPAVMTSQIDRFLAPKDPAAPPIIKTPARAVMLPHAGWVYCGQTLGQTLARALVPDTVIVVGPKHTPYGPVASVASHDTWIIPGAAIPVATDLVHRFTEKLRGLSREPDAHRLEHGTEVLLPFLHRINPGLRVAPVVLGVMPFEDAAAVGRAMARLVQESNDAGRRVLLVISSDMNHFAPDAEGRRRDRLALDAMATGDPRKLYDTCIEHDISMCGVLPAVAVMTALQQTTPDIQPQLIAYSTSGDTSGDRARVVGYAGVVIP